jgi:hypothetical protein
MGLIAPDRQVFAWLLAHQELKMPGQPVSVLLACA